MFRASFALCLHSSTFLLPGSACSVSLSGAAGPLLITQPFLWGILFCFSNKPSLSLASLALLSLLASNCRGCPWGGCENQWATLRAGPAPQLWLGDALLGVEITVQSAGLGRRSHLPGCKRLHCFISISLWGCNLWGDLPAHLSDGHPLLSSGFPESEMNFLSCHWAPLLFFPVLQTRRRASFVISFPVFEDTSSISLSLLWVKEPYFFWPFLVDGVFQIYLPCSTLVYVPLVHILLKCRTACCSAAEPLSPLRAKGLPVSCRLQSHL